MTRLTRLGPATVIAGLLLSTAAIAQSHDVDTLKAEVKDAVTAKAKLTQEIIDSIFSFAEIGYNEREGERYLTGILQDAGFTVETGIGGIPTAWLATWSNGTGKPAISLNSDLDGLPGLSQKPGVLDKEPLVEGGNGHGEGHNTGIAVSVVSALALKEVMEKEGIDGTLQVWPGIAEEILGGKVWYVHNGVFDNIDAVLSNHVGNQLGTSWGVQNSLSMVSVEYSFKGVTAHAATMPWMGRSALDAVELMDTAWNFRREHLNPEQRSHYVITNGGSQPNIVPGDASVWYYFRNIDAAKVREMFAIADRMAEAATMMTDTTWSRRILGSAWPSHGNKVLAEVTNANIEAVGMPQWSEDDQAYARAVQAALGAEVTGLPTEPRPLGQPVDKVTGGASDDIGAVFWTLPTVRLSYPSNIAGTRGHSWEAALASATPIAHKGAVVGAEVTAMTAMDLLLKPDLIAAAKDYFDNVQTRDIQYVPFEGPDDRPAIDINDDNDARNRPLQEPFYYDASKFDSYLDQLGVKYPMLSE